MDNILNQIVESNRVFISQKKEIIKPKDMERRALAEKIDSEFPFEKALKKDSISFICEIKKASPSKGVIDPVFDYKKIADEYDAAGADAISVLTEPRWFMGNEEVLEDVAKRVSAPCLRKDFIIDEYMIHEAKILGAKAVLVICAILDEERVKRYIDCAHALGMSALVEAHDLSEIEMACNAGAHIIGINNRNLKNFSVDINNGLKLRKYVPNDVIFVAESGIKTAADIQVLKENDVDAVLIGETLMRAEDKKKMLTELRG